MSAVIWRLMVYKINNKLKWHDYRGKRCEPEKH